MGQCLSHGSRRNREGHNSGNQGPQNLRNTGDGAQRNAVALSYRDLQTATHDFRDAIGEGRFGDVWRGTLERTGQIICVKNLSNFATQDVRMFVEEVTALSRLRHPNIVNLIGYCAEGNKRLLVYECMVGGSLDWHLYERPDAVLDWNTRMKIALGVARGLNYLHNEADPPVIFGDLKSPNILLDDEFNPKLSDIGLEKFETPQLSARDRRSGGYMAPEYAPNTSLTIKADVYTFGIAFLELISGYRPARMIQGDQHLLIALGRPFLANPAEDLYSLADIRMGRGFPVGSLRRALEVALLCVEDDPQARPNMNVVVEGIAAAAAAAAEEVVEGIAAAAAAAEGGG